MHRDIQRPPARPWLWLGALLLAIFGWLASALANRLELALWVSVAVVGIAATMPPHRLVPLWRHQLPCWVSTAGWGGLAWLVRRWREPLDLASSAFLPHLHLRVLTRPELYGGLAVALLALSGWRLAGGSRRRPPERRRAAADHEQGDPRPAR